MAGAAGETGRSSTRKCLFSSPQPAARYSSQPQPGFASGSSRAGASVYAYACPVSAAGTPAAAAADAHHSSSSWRAGSGALGSAGGLRHSLPASSAAASPYHSGAAWAGRWKGGIDSKKAPGSGTAAGLQQDESDVYGGLDVGTGDAASSVTSEASQYEAWQQELSFRLGSALRKLEQQPVR